MRMAREAMCLIMECRKPLIAAINGPAIGVGFGLTSVCDILVASGNAYMNLPEIDVGLMGGAEHVMRLFRTEDAVKARTAVLEKHMPMLKGR